MNKPIPDYPEYNYNQWYDAKTNDRPKVLYLLCFFPKEFDISRFVVCYPNADWLSSHQTGKRWDYSDCSKWMALEKFPE